MNSETEKETMNLPATTETATAVPVIVEPSSSTAAINKYLAEEAPQETIGKLLKFSKGEFLKGMDGEEVPEGALFTLACDLTMRGFIRWVDNKPAEQRIVRIASGDRIPRLDELSNRDQTKWEVDSKTGKKRDPWQPVMYMPMLSEAGELCTFTTGSNGGIKLLDRTLRRYAMHAKRHPGDYPLIRLAVDSYMHSDRSIGKVFVPDFEPAGYVSKAEFMEALAAVGVIIETSDTPALSAPSSKDEMNDSLEF